MPRATVKDRPKKTDPSEKPAPTCQHHWYIATPAGSTSKGICRRCGEERQFRNSTTDYISDGSGSGAGTPWRGTRPGKTTADDPDQIGGAGAAAGSGVPV